MTSPQQSAEVKKINHMLTIPARLLIAVLASCLLALPTSADAGEKKKLTYGKTSRTTISEIKSTSGNGREFVQGVYSDAVKSSDPDWNGIEERVFDQTEGVNGTGTHRGTAVDIFRNGDQLFQNYIGSHKTTVTGDSWETAYQGTAEFVGGTGKYKNAKGKLTYRGKFTPQGIEEEDIVELEY
jgi:hypothetical protein